MDVSPILYALFFAILGAAILLLIYMAARAGAQDGVKDAEKERGGKR